MPLLNQAAAGLVLALSAARLRLRYAVRRFRFSILLYCLPITRVFTSPRLFGCVRTMMFSVVRFNIYLAAAALLVCLTACSSPKDKEKKLTSAISLHLEISPTESDDTGAVPIFRDKPVYVNVEKQAFVDEGDLESASVLNDLGGFHIRLKFNWHGAMLLDGVTTDNHNHRIAVLAKWDKESRWLAAPEIRRRMADGVFDFTPDATREEADRIVKGLNNLAKKLKEKDSF